MKQAFVLVLLAHRDALNGPDVHLLQAATEEELCRSNRLSDAS